MCRGLEKFTKGTLDELMIHMHLNGFLCFTIKHNSILNIASMCWLNIFFRLIMHNNQANGNCYRYVFRWKKRTPPFFYFLKWWRFSHPFAFYLGKLPLKFYGYYTTCFSQLFCWNFGTLFLNWTGESDFKDFLAHLFSSVW